jgi:hypothetical protein
MLHLQVISSTMSEEFLLPRSRKIAFFFSSFPSSDATVAPDILAVATHSIRAYGVVAVTDRVLPKEPAHKTKGRR